MDNRETPGNKTIRLSKERLIVDYNKAEDSDKVNKALDTYPYGKERPPISLEQARHVANLSLQLTVETAFTPAA